MTSRHPVRSANASNPEIDRGLRADRHHRPQRALDPDGGQPAGAGHLAEAGRLRDDRHRAAVDADRGEPGDGVAGAFGVHRALDRGDLAARVGVDLVAAHLEGGQLGEVEDVVHVHRVRGDPQARVLVGGEVAQRVRLRRGRRPEHGGGEDGAGDGAERRHDPPDHAPSSASVARAADAVTRREPRVDPQRRGEIGAGAGLVAHRRADRAATEVGPGVAGAQRERPVGVRQRLGADPGATRSRAVPRSAQARQSLVHPGHPVLGAGHERGEPAGTLRCGLRSRRAGLVVGPRSQQDGGGRGGHDGDADHQDGAAPVHAHTPTNAVRGDGDTGRNIHKSGQSGVTTAPNTSLAHCLGASWTRTNTGKHETGSSRSPGWACRWSTRS